MTYASLPFNPLNILAPDIPDDNKFRQWISIYDALKTSAGWSAVMDTGVTNVYANSMAFSRLTYRNSGINTGGTLANSANYPNAAMDNSTATYWNSNGQPTLNSTNAAVGYDAGSGQTLSPTYIQLWLQGSAAATDPVTFVVEHAGALDVNYDWAGAAFIPVMSAMNVNTTAGALSVASVSLSAISGTGYIVNTTATVGTGGGASTTTSAAYNIATAATAPNSTTLSVASSSSFANGDYIQVSDGTHTNHFVVTATATGTITGTLLPVPGDTTTGTMGSAATVIQCGLGAVVQPVISGGAVTSLLNVNPGVGYHVGDTVSFQVASSGAGATATVAAVNAQGMIQSYTISAGGSSYVANPTATGSGGTGSCSYAVFTNAAIGVGGAIQQVIPCTTLIGSTYQSGGGGYAYGTPPTITIAQASGGSSPTGAGTPTAKLTMSTSNAAQLNRFDICTQFWSSVSGTTGPTDRAFELRVLANVSSTTSVNIYEFQLYTYGGTYINNTPFRLAPTSSQASTFTAVKIYQMQDTIQTASGSSGCPLYERVSFGSSSTWSYPALMIQNGQGESGGVLLSPNATGTITAACTAGSPVTYPLYCNGNTNWWHITMFKGLSTCEMLIHTERNQASATNGTDSAVNGVTTVVATAALGAYSMVMPQYGAPPGIEQYLGATLGYNAGSQGNGFVQAEYIRPRMASVTGGWGPELKRLIVTEGLTDGSTPTFNNAYGVSQQFFVDASQCTKVTSVSTNTLGRLAVQIATS